MTCALHIIASYLNVYSHLYTLIFLTIKERPFSEDKRGVNSDSFLRSLRDQTSDSHDNPYMETPTSRKENLHAWVLVTSIMCIPYLDVMKYVHKYLLFGYSKVWVIVVWVRTLVDDAIHIQVKIVKIGDLRSKCSSYTTRLKYQMKYQISSTK